MHGQSLQILDKVKHATATSTKTTILLLCLATAVLLLCTVQCGQNIDQWLGIEGRGV